MIVQERTEVRRIIVPGTIRTRDMGAHFTVNFVGKDKDSVNCHIGTQAAQCSQTFGASDLRELAKLLFCMADVLDARK